MQTFVQQYILKIYFTIIGHDMYLPLYCKITWVTIHTTHVMIFALRSYSFSSAITNPCSYIASPMQEWSLWYGLISYTQRSLAG